jgi:hypothetical protein
MHDAAAAVEVWQVSGELFRIASTEVERPVLLRH